MSIGSNTTNKGTRVEGHILVEVLLAIAIFTVIAASILGGFVSVRDGKVSQKQTLLAKGYLDQEVEAFRSVREREGGWDLVSAAGIYHTNLNGAVWELLPNPITVDGFTRQVEITDVCRNKTSGAVVSSCGDADAVPDPATKRVTITISWGPLDRQRISISYYITRYGSNDVSIDTDDPDFIGGQLSGTQVSSGSVKLANNAHARWCDPELMSATIDLPDGPPVAVTAWSNSTDNSIPNDVLVATSPDSDNSIKLAYVTVPANVDEGEAPSPSLKGRFTLDSSKYSNSSFIPVGIGLDNNFKTNDVKYYVSSGVTTTGFLSPSSNIAGSGGDNNGFESSPTSAYADDSSYARDVNSGNTNTTGCTDAGKDKHVYYGYSPSIPSGVYIGGIEVRLDAWADSTIGSPKMCVQLSWDGGVTWTSAKSTPTLTTGQTTYTLGGSGDTWSRTWNTQDLTNANFRVRVTNVASSTSRDFSLDWVALKVYYTTGVGRTYALLATTKSDKEVIAVLVNDGNPDNDNDTSGEFADPVNNIYKYWTYFNTRIYQGASSNDQAPYGYGGVSMDVFGDRGYVLSGGYLYVFNLANIDSKSPSDSLDMVGCRIQLDGYDCQPPSSGVKKYGAGQTGTTYSDTSSPIHSDCSDGGNTELYADNDVNIVQVGSNLYAHIAVGGVTNPELNIANVTSVPTSGSSPSISNSSCGRISGGNSGWRRISSLDFNGGSGTEEAANSVYINTDGDRTYISSNGGVDENNDGQPDSFQFYILDTGSKSSPRFLSGTSSPPTSGYYYGQKAPAENKQLYPRRSMTVLDGARAVLVGKDGVDDENDAEDYQVLKMEGEEDGTSCSEEQPCYCGGVDFDQGFNDLTSVVEADSDSFVYMVADTDVNELKIIQGGEDGTYVASGVFESEAIDVGVNKTAMFNRVDITADIPSGTILSFKVATYGDGTLGCNAVTPKFVGPDGAEDSSYTLAGGQIAYFDLPAPNQNPARCFKYQATFTSDGNRDKTPVLNSFTVNYSK